MFSFRWCLTGIALLGFLDVGLSMSVDLRSLLERQYDRQREFKRVGSGNPCKEEEPFECKGVKKCISLTSVCDQQYDCPDRWDEGPELCTAKSRPALTEVFSFLQGNPWFMKNLLKGEAKMTDVAHALIVSPNLRDFKERLHLGKAAVKNFKAALNAIEEENIRVLMKKFKMPKGSVFDVEHIMSGLLESGF